MGRMRAGGMAASRAVSASEACGGAFLEGSAPPPQPARSEMSRTVGLRGRAARIGLEMSMPLDLSLSVGEMFEALASSLPSGGDAPSLPPGVKDAKMIFKGSVGSSGSAVVLASDGDLVRMHADMDIDMKVEAVGFPSEMTQGQPTNLSVEGTMKIDVVRTA
jgi:hypothetical protein